MHVPLTVIILTFNEELNLPTALESVCGWADQVLVVDSLSTDGTRDIAAQYGVPVVDYTITPFYISEKRSWALENSGVETEWVLFLDADEVATPEFKKRIAETLQNVPEEITAFQLTPRFMFMGRWLRHCLGYPNWHDRLVRRGRVRFAGGMWEHFVTDGRVSRIHEPYLHFGLNKGFADWIAKHNWYSDFDAQDILATLDGDDGAPQGTHFGRTRRKRRLRDLAARFWPLRPVARFVYMYFLKLGFLDGIPGLLYCLMMAFYEYMVVLKVIELKRRRAGLPM